MHVYMAVTPDEYELPLYLADTPRQLASILGITPNAVSSSIYKQRSGKNKGYTLIKVELEQE